MRALRPVLVAVMLLAAARPADAQSSEGVSGAQFVTGWIGSVALGFAAWRAFDEPAGQHSRVKDDWGYTPRAHVALAIGSYVGSTLGIWLKGRSNRAGGSLWVTALGTAPATAVIVARRDDPLLPFMLPIAFAPLQSFVGYELYRLSARPGLEPPALGRPAVVAERRSTQRTENTIGGSEIAKSAAVTAYDAVSQLRPHWLTTARLRSPIEREQAGEPGVIVVYLDGIRYGTVESLRQLSVEGVREIRYLSAVDATNKFGTGHPAGAIDVVMSKAP